MRFPAIKLISLNKGISKLLILAIAIGQWCCQNKDKQTASPTVEFSSVYQVDTLRGEAILDGFSFVNPWQVEIFDSLLVVIDKNNTKGGILIFDLNTRDFLTAIGKTGQGPGEFLGLKKIEVNDKGIWAFDVTLRTLTRFDLNKVLSEKCQDPDLREEVNPGITNLALLNDSLFVASYYVASKRFSVNTFGSGEPLKVFGDYPPLDNIYGLDSIRFKYGVVANLLQSKMLYNAKHDAIVLSYFFTALIQIIDMERGIVEHSLYGPDKTFPPEYEMTGDGRSVLAGNAKEGYLDISLTDNYIYALYSGKTDHLDITSNQIFQFDWNGKPIRKFIVDHNLIAFVVDEKDEKIYGIDFSDNPLIEFELPE